MQKEKLNMMKAKEPLFEYISSDISHKIVNGDSLSVLKKLENGKFDLIITSPPYNIGKSYETKTSIEKYLGTQEEIINELVRTLSDKGNLCWQVGNYVHKGEVFPLDIYYYQIFKKLGMKLRNRIIWHFGHGLHASNRFSGRYETILWFSKTDDYIFNLDNVRIPSKYPGKLHFKGEKKGLPSGNPLGKNPSDIWEIIANDWETAMWNIPNVKSNHPEKTEHPCQFPIELAERCVLALTDEKSWVLDPFAGVGSTVIAAIKNNRNAMGIEKENEYCIISNQRIKDLSEGKLKIRPINKPIHKPTGKDRVSQIPKEWLQLELKNVNGKYNRVSHQK
ncbi:MAG TPA: site-specific DNA-methyltransferase [Ignavibacteriaceae bacterium]|nr:site-specific DNA-methyltransferase [Ignavibacteriaceae bacterium]